MSDEVSQFLEQVEQLRGKQIEDDELRAREHEEFMAAKRQRQARRQEHARSISPQKSSPANTPSPRAHARTSNLPGSLKLDSSLVLNESLQDSSNPLPSSPGMGFSQSPTKENESPFNRDSKHDTHAATSSSTPPTTVGLARTSTLSWQQRRPNSRGTPTTRPLSMMAAHNASQRGVARTQDSFPTSPADPQHQTLSRQDIAKTLGLKDPSWFRQTAERGQGSAALRKSQVEDDDAMDMSSIKTQLPGMSDAPGKTVASPIPAGLASAFPLNSPGLHAAEDSSRDNPSPIGRSSPVRTPSPTKGLGGFVQSAMMKRSDSIKRWSVTSPPSLSRADSVSGIIGGPGDASRPSSRPPSTIRDSATSDPNQPTPQNELGDTNTVVSPEVSTQSALSHESSDSKLPISPSKTMDSRRWSPTKSSWLESALNRPDSPRSQHKSTPTQPDWMAELARSKAASPSHEGSRPGSPHKHQVSIGGLMRTTPFDGGAKTNPTGLGGIYSPPPGGNRPKFGHGSKHSFSSISAEQQPASSLEMEAPQTPTPQGNRSHVKSETERQDSAELPRQQEPSETNPIKRSSANSSPSETNPIKRGSVNSPPSANPNSTASPQRDFRASLRQRPANSSVKQAEEPEFRNALGNLRRTKTQNYVAPDALKGNILRGKAALAVTGGPQKTERKDEFKESILKKREDFKKAQADGKGVARLSKSSSQPPVLPEGLVKRAELGKTGLIRENSHVAAAASKRPETFKPVPASKPVPSDTSATSLKSTTAKTTAPEMPRPLFTEPESKVANTEADRVSGIKKEASASANMSQRRSETNKLSDRFNQNLAGMLARGPPPMASNGGQRSEDGHATNSAPAAEPSAPGPQLTHMTKGRARGPKRRAPTPAAAPKATSSSAVREPTGVQASPTLAETTAGESEDKNTALPVQGQAVAETAARGKPSLQLPRETTTRKTKDESKMPAKTYSRELSLDQANIAAASPSPEATGSQDIAKDRKQSPLSVNPSPDLVENSDANVPEPTPPPKSTQSHKLAPTTKPEVSPKPAPISVPSPASVPSEKPTTPREKQFSTPTRAMPSRSFGTVGVSSPRPNLHGPRPQAESRPKSRNGRPLSGVGISASAIVPESPMPSPTKQPGEIIAVFKDFFGPPRPRKDYKVDTAEVLMNHAETSTKIQTQEVQMYQLSGDGRKTPVSAQNERVLFDGEMYICAHSFSNAVGKSSVELYFWVGDEVPDGAAQDAQIFAQREAKAIGGRLLKLYQGKETAEFVHALGGVIIVRRGNNARFDSLAPHMLCGRRYLGQVAFDQVDMTTASLCAGFPFLVSAGGKCYLWKGKGSDIDELSAARLVGMELSITGELTELEEGDEPASFWQLFEAGQSSPHSADHWRLKPNYRKYGSRLFCSDADARHQISEIAPFNQSDLSPLKIYVLDAFFEVYIVVGSGAQSQYSSFRNALDFAQEYAILSAGMEDRPFVPVSTIVLEGIPRDLKRVFRKWDDGRSPTVTNTYSGLKRGRSLRVVPLSQALQALKE